MVSYIGGGGTIETAAVVCGRIDQFMNNRDSRKWKALFFPPYILTFVYDKVFQYIAYKAYNIEADYISTILFKQ